MKFWHVEHVYICLADSTIKLYSFLIYKILILALKYTEVTRSTVLEFSGDDGETAILCQLQGVVRCELLLTLVSAYTCTLLFSTALHNLCHTPSYIHVAQCFSSVNWEGLLVLPLWKIGEPTVSFFLN